MGYARKMLICLDDTTYYHVMARCVRRAWLWGFDEYAGKDYSHRKQWVVQRLRHLANSFAIDVCAYAIMANHYHLVLNVDRNRAASWTRDEVVARWAALFKIPVVIQQWQQGTGGDAVREKAEVKIESLRRRLYDISSYMACLNAHLARRANTEDGCTGRFWEGRFKSQALLDEPALITAMAYVDLNPVRAGVVATPEESEFTSIYQRLAAIASDKRAPGVIPEPIVPLVDFRSDEATTAKALPFTLRDYLMLLDWSGRAIRADKRGTIDARAPPILDRLKIDAYAWTKAMRPNGNVFGRALGQLDRLRHHAKMLGQSWIKGIAEARRLYQAA
jgi:REP element-mobilizing transposase RayT